MDFRLIFKTALLAGEIMLRNGAETYRVEDTINRILKTTKFTVIESYVTPTGLFATLDDPSIDSITMVRRVGQRTIHMGKVEKVNNVSREYVSGQITVYEAYARLLVIKDLEPYSRFIHILCYGIIAACFTVVFGGTPRDFITSLIIGLFLGVLHKWMESRQISKFINDIISSGIVGLLSISFTQYLPIGTDIDTIIIGCIMPLVPGLAITNAIRDTLEGDLVSGLARALEAFIIAISIAVGIAISLSLFYI